MSHFSCTFELILRGKKCGKDFFFWAGKEEPLFLLLFTGHQPSLQQGWKFSPSHFTIREMREKDRGKKHNMGINFLFWCRQCLILVLYHIPGVFWPICVSDYENTFADNTSGEEEAFSLIFYGGSRKRVLKVFYKES